MTLDNWDSASPKEEISVSEMDALVKDYRKARETYEEANKKAKDLYSEKTKAELKLLAI